MWVVSTPPPGCDTGSFQVLLYPPLPGQHCSLGVCFVQTLGSGSATCHPARAACEGDDGQAIKPWGESCRRPIVCITVTAACGLQSCVSQAAPKIIPCLSQGCVWAQEPGKLWLKPSRHSQSPKIASGAMERGAGLQGVRRGEVGSGKSQGWGRILPRCGDTR